MYCRFRRRKSTDFTIIRFPDQFSGAARVDESCRPIHGRHSRRMSIGLERCAGKLELILLLAIYPQLMRDRLRRLWFGTSDSSCRRRYWNSCWTSTPVLSFCFLGGAGCAQSGSTQQPLHLVSGPSQPAASPHADWMSQSFAVPFPQRQRGNPKPPGGFVRVVNFRRLLLHQNSSILSITSTFSIVSYDIVGYTLLYYVMHSQYRLFSANSSATPELTMCLHKYQQICDGICPTCGRRRTELESRSELSEPGDLERCHGASEDPEGTVEGVARVGSELTGPKASKTQLDLAR
jgi:hypothetical protein